MSVRKPQYVMGYLKNTIKIWSSEQVYPDKPNFLGNSMDIPCPPPPLYPPSPTLPPPHNPEDLLSVLSNVAEDAKFIPIFKVNANDDEIER